MASRLRDARGFTLVEMAVVILILGLIIGFSIPAFVKMNRSLALKGTVQNLANHMQLARQTAIATGKPQTLHLFQGTFGVDYHIHNPGENPSAYWKFPTGITYLWSGGTLSAQTVIMRPDGRADRSGMVILQSQSGLMDTVNVQLSGLVLLQ